MKLTKVLAVVFFSALLVVISQTTFAEEFPDELRVVAKHLAHKFHSSIDEASKVPSDHEIGLRRQLQLLDLRAIKSNHREIQHVADEAHTAISDIITQAEILDSLPASNHWWTFGVGIIEACCWLAGYSTDYPGAMTVEVGTYVSLEKAAINDAVKGFWQAQKKWAVTRQLLPRVVKSYAAKETTSNNGDRICMEVHDYPCFADVLNVVNNGAELRDCILEVKIVDKANDSATSVFFVEKFENGKELYATLSLGLEYDGELILQQTVGKIKSAELTLLSPQYSTSITYEYGQQERDDDYKAMFKDVKLTQVYSEATEGIFSNWCRYSTVYMEGFSRLPPCTLAVFFDGEYETYSASDSGWTDGLGWTIYGNNKLEDKCRVIRAEVTFPDTSFKITGSWQVAK